MIDKLFVNEKEKVLQVGKWSYPLLYALCCPISKKPLLLVVKSSSNLLGRLVPRGGDVIREGKITGLLYRYAQDKLYVETVKANKGEDDTQSEYLSIRYFFGLKRDPLAEWVFKYANKDASLDRVSFREKLFEGKLEGFHVCREVIHGEDLVVACVEDSKQ